MAQLRFDGRVAVVTGGGRGLGRAYCELLGSRGAKVVVNDPGYSPTGVGVDASVAQEVVDVIKKSGADAVVSTDSVATREGGKAIIQAALDHFGKIDILIHNAGNNRRASIKEMSYEDFDSVIDTHLRGAFHVVRPSFPLMCKQGYGRVVMTSSIGGIYGSANVVNYASAKGGIIGMSHNIALEGAAEGVKSNVILPGALTRLAAGRDTSQYPDMRPELVAPVVGWLAHESCSVTGELFISMAGRVAKAYVAETVGVFQPEWSVEDVPAKMAAISDKKDSWILPPVPTAHYDHIFRSFDMAKGVA